jgi:DNA-binding CsgD family transcriptional regulator
MSVKAVRSRVPQEKPLEDPRDLQTLVRKLIAHAIDSAAAPSHPSRTTTENQERKEDVLVDCEIDGVRCVLVRSSETADKVLLSPREQEVARMIAKGYPNKIIASVLDISVWTVSTHLRRIYAKLGVTSRAAMVSKVLKSGKL